MFTTDLMLLAVFLSSLLFSDIPAASATPPSARPERVTVTAGGRVDMCLSCHRERPDTSHGRDVLGCAVCHLGDALAGRKKQAHRGMVLNPGELAVVDLTCGRPGCHADEVKWVKNSLMATNRGIISTLRYYWGESPDNREEISVSRLKETGMNSPALDYYRKLCGSCHLWVEKGTLPFFLSTKGGGCTACHYLKRHPGYAGEKDHGHVFHPWITRSVPMENCIRCHNRSGRIGLSYRGEFESEGYGTPYVEGDLSPAQYADGRFFLKVKADVHHEKGIVCIDCHTQREIMGDGTYHAHFEEQLEVTCLTCHNSVEALETVAAASMEETGLQEKSGGSERIPKLDIRKKGPAFFLEDKSSKKLHRLNPPDPVSCGNPVHSRLACQACHSTWVPQCYGCHVRMNRREKQLDKIALKETPGRWKEYRSFIRYESPPLGILEGHDSGSGRGGTGGKVVVMVPG